MLTAKKIVLVIDDQKSFRGIYRDNLERAGYEVIDAENGMIGMEKLQQHPKIDLVLLDIAMPLKSGVEVLTEMRKTPSYKDIPVIVLSVFDERVRFYDDVVKLGISGYFVKGRGSLDELMEAINKILGGNLIKLDPELKK